MANDPRPRGPAEAPAATSGPCALAEASPGDSGAPAPKAEWRGLAGHRDWPRPASLAQRARAAGAERKWRLSLCTNHVRAGECHSAPGAGRRARGGHSDLTASRRPPEGSPAPNSCPRGRRTVPGGSPPPHLARSVAKAGRAQRARPAPGRPRGPGGARS